VLTGGASRRMGRDKALVEVAGRSLLTVAADALRDAGANPVLAVGGDAVALLEVEPRLIAVDDLHPGEGPLGGILTAFAAARTVTPDPSTLVVVVACDMPALDGATIRELVDAAVAEPAAGLAAAIVDGRPQPLTGVWRPALAEAVLRAAFDAGERAPRRLLDRLVVVGVHGLHPEALADVDRPEDLARYAGRRDGDTVRSGCPTHQPIPIDEVPVSDAAPIGPGPIWNDGGNSLDPGASER
jgi:molybdenum cofactor guanylyltransferase